MKKRFPVSAKAITLVLVSALVLVEVAMVYFSLVTAGSNQKNYRTIADNLSSTIAATIDADQVKDLKDQVKSIVDASPTHPMSSEWGSDEWNAYTAQFDGVKESPSFLAVHKYLTKVAEAQHSSDIDCAYLAYLDAEREFFVYLCDSATEDPCPPGCLDPIFDFNREVLINPMRGFPAYITNTEEYGWLVTAGSPIVKGNEVVAYALTDISMTTIRKSQADRILQLFFYLTSTTIGIAVLLGVVIHFMFIRPLRRLVNVAKSYDISEPEKTHEAFQALTLRTHDEVQELCESIRKMEDDVHTKIGELTAMNRELVASHEETKKMTELANKDALTGVRNKVSYDHEVGKLDQLILNGKPTPFGVAMIDLNDLKVINDKFGHVSGNIALVKLSNIICAIFAHSPVFRVGGDEFVALLTNADYRNADKLIAEFEAKIHDLSLDEELSMPEKTSAAIGYAAFDPKTDTSVNDVFNRADEAMYVNKRKMKERK